MSTKARKVAACECVSVCVCVCVRVHVRMHMHEHTCEYCQKRKLPLQVHRGKNTQTLKPQSKRDSSPIQA